MSAPFEAHPKTRVLVLGTVHLGATSDAFKIAVPELPEVVFHRLLEALAPHAQDGVLIEADAPESVAFRAAALGWEDALARYPWLEGARRAQAALGLGFSEARSRFLRGDPAPAEELALLALAAYEPHSALLWWMRTGQGAKRRVPEDVQAMLDRGLSSPSDAVRIGVRLAQKLGHRRVHAVDDGCFRDLPPGQEDRIEELWEALRERPRVRAVLERYQAEMKKKAQQLARAAAAGDLVPFYLAINEERSLLSLLDQWRVLFTTGHPEGLDRARVMMWEARNLGMVRNARVAMATHPGGRFFWLVGGSHKPFLEAYLQALVDVELVPVGAALTGA